MKKIISVLLATIMVFAMASCGGGSGTVKDKNLIEIDDYAIKYIDHELITYEGDDVLVVNYQFTNNSQAATSLFASSLYEAYQGEEFLSGITVFLSDDSLDALSDSAFEDVAPGESLEVTLTYLLKDTTTPVRVEFSSIFENTTKDHTIDIAAVADVDEQEEEPADNEKDVVIADGDISDSEWYGWWMVSDGTGEYEEYDGAYFDCCVNLEPTDEGYVLMSIWDEVFTSYEDNCVSEIFFDLVDGEFVPVEGYFLTGDAEHVIDVTAVPEISGLENTFFITVDVEDETGSFKALIYLTEWGYEWDEEFADAPMFYDSYFLPLMEDGESLPAELDDIG